MNIRRDIAVRLYGVVWLAVGLMLMFKGTPMVVKAATQPQLPLISLLKPLVGSCEQAAMVLVVSGLLLGFIKGRTVLAKAARKSIERVKGFEVSFPMKKFFSARYVILLGIMMGLGFLLRVLKLPVDVHGLIDVAIGSALIQGAMVYFRSASLVIERPASNL